MTDRASVAVAGVGNNGSALVQGVHYYRALKARQPDAELPGIRRHVIDGLGVDDLEFVAGYDVTAAKVGKDISGAIFAEPNNDLRLDVEIPASSRLVTPMALRCIISCSSRLRDDERANRRAPGAERGIVDVVLVVLVGFVRVVSAGWRLAQFRHELS